jgi:rubrerythrin
MNQILQEQLQKIFMEMTRGAARKKIYAMRAEQEGNKALASLFLAISNSESAQATRFLIQLRGQTGSNEQNCSLAFDHELPATINIFEQTGQLASDIQEKALHSACAQSAKVQRMHLSLKKKLDRKNTQDIATSYHVCQFCGFIMENNAPENCPICTAPASRFQEVTA